MSLKTCIRVLPLALNSLKYTKNPLFKPQISCCLYSVQSKNFCHNLPVRFSSTNANPHKQDAEVKQIYYGILTPQIKAVKIFSLSSSIVGIVSQPFLYKAIASSGSVAIVVAAYSFIGFFTVVTPFLLHFMTKKYITSLGYRESTGSYVAQTVNFFCITKQTEFKPDEVVVPDVPGMFTTFVAKGRSLFLDPRMFEYPEHYAKIMGYDKPMDFKLYNPPSSTALNEKKS